MELGEMMDACRAEIAEFNMGHIGYEDFYDEETGEQLPTTCEETIAKLERTIERIKHLMNHNCAYSSNDICIHCGSDGRA